MNFESIAAKSTEASVPPVDVVKSKALPTAQVDSDVADAIMGFVAAEAESTATAWGDINLDFEVTDLEERFVDCPSLGSPAATDIAPHP
jgi:hypothetical protein